jgi:hypothetical protein
VATRSISVEQFFIWLCFLVRKIIGGYFYDHKSQKRAKRRDEIEAAKQKELVVLLDFVI